MDWRQLFHEPVANLHFILLSIHLVKDPANCGSGLTLLLFICFEGQLLQRPGLQALASSTTVNACNDRRNSLQSCVEECLAVSLLTRILGCCMSKLPRTEPFVFRRIGWDFGEYSINGHIASLIYFVLVF